MELPNAQILVDEADRLLKDASNELQRSEEDVTATLVCFNARQSIINYLSSYLMRNNIEIQTPVTMAGLLEQCKAEDGRFQLMDISEINCNHDETNDAYCLNITKVSDCYRIAEIAKGIVHSDIPAY